MSTQKPGQPWVVEKSGRLCNGRLVPEHWSLQTVIEFTHRFLVGLVTPFLLLLCICALWKYRKWLEVKVLLATSVGFVALEALLGAIGVLHSDPPPVLATHFGVALVAFVGVLLTSIVVYQIRQAEKRGTAMLRGPSPDRATRLWVWVSVVYVYIAMYVGAYVASSGFGDHFRGWPIPLESGPAVIVDYIHRSIAIGLFAIIVWIFVKCRQLRQIRPDLYTGSLIALILVCMQVLAGMYLVLSHLSQQALLLHVTVISLLFGTLAYLALQVLPEPHRQRLG